MSKRSKEIIALTKRQFARELTKEFVENRIADILAEQDVPIGKQLSFNFFTSPIHRRRPTKWYKIVEVEPEYKHCKCNFCGEYTFATPAVRKRTTCPVCRRKA